MWVCPVCPFDSGRVRIWGYAWDIAKDHFITGVGFYTGVDLAMPLLMSNMKQLEANYDRAHRHVNAPT